MADSLAATVRSEPVGENAFLSPGPPSRYGLAYDFRQPDFPEGTRRTSARLLSASLIAQQPAASQSTANTSKKHVAGVKYESISVERTEQTPPKTQPSAPAPETAKRKDGAIVAGDFNQKQSGAPLKGVGAVSHSDATTPADKGTGSAGIPSKAAPSSAKKPGAPIKGAIYK